MRRTMGLTVEGVGKGPRAPLARFRSVRASDGVRGFTQRKIASEGSVYGPCCFARAGVNDPGIRWADGDDVGARRLRVRRRRR
jgi:hypothetical protein